MKTLLNNRFYVVFLIPFFLGSLTVFSFTPYNFTLINFFSFSFLLFLILLVKKKTQSNYRKKRSYRYFFYLGCSFGYGFFLIGNYWISISLTHDEVFKGLIPLSLLVIPIFLSLFFGLAILVVGPFANKNISFVLLFSLVFAIFEFLRGSILTGFPWNLISYTWSWSLESIQSLSLIGTYSFSLITITFFSIPFIFLNQKIYKKNIVFLFFFLIMFFANYIYGLDKISYNEYSFDEEINIKVVSPNFTLKDYKTETEMNQLKRLIKISNPDKNKKTLFIWPEGIFYESYLKDITQYKNLFEESFSENHLVALGITSSIDSNILADKKYFNSLVILNNKLEVIAKYNKINLVPFGEFLPYEKFLSKFGLKKITQG